MSRLHVLLIATMASLWGHQAGADISLSTTLLRPKPGEEVSFDCTLTGVETFVGWFKRSDGSKVSSSLSETVRVETDGSKHTLRFTNVEVSQGGQYECRGSINRKTCTLEVAYETSGVDHNQHVTIRQTQNIELGVRGYPKPKFTWKKGTRTLNPASDPHYTLLEDGSLRINIVRVDDEGNYTVIIEQSGYKGTEYIEVYAVEIPKIEPFTKKRVYLTEGHSASFVCKATGRPTPKYEWYNPAGTLITSVGNFFVKDGNLTIIKVLPNLKGIYKCVAFNEIGKTKERIGKDESTVEIVDVYVAPKITSKGGDKDLNRGDDFTLECKATGRPTPNVVWKRNGERDPRQEQSAGQSIIKFISIQADDDGKYTCEAKNEAVDSSGNNIVAVIERNINIRSPPFIITHASPYEVFSYLGNSHPTFVTCTFGGHPDPWIIMTFDKKMVSNATTTANVSVKTDAKKKFGKFHCFAKNLYGSKNQTVELKEVGKPSEVLDFKGEPTCNSVELTWKLPLKDGGMPIDKFVLEYRGITRNIDAPKTKITITGLKQDTDYTFNIRATNRGEWGPITSKEVTTEKYCVPGRPVIYEPQSVDIDQTSFTLKWRRPQATGGDDDIEYIVRYRDETDDDKPGPWKESTTKKLEYEIKDLEKQKKYKVEVIAKNEAGKGTPDERFFHTGKVLGTGSQSQLVASLLLTFTVYILHFL